MRRKYWCSAVSYLPDAPPAEVVTALHEAQVLVLKSKLRVTATVLDQAPRLRLIVRAGIGLDHIDLDACAARGVRVAWTPGANARPVGEQALGMLLSLMHRIRRADAAVRQGLWPREANRGWELANRTVGIIGYGHTGQAFARTLTGFGCQVLAYDKYRTAYADNYAQEATWEQIETEAEVLSLHVPLTSETQHLVDAARLARMPRLRWLLNLARGEVLDVPAALDALDAGKLDGLALDVLPEEPPVTPDAKALLARLAAHERVIVTPHIGGWSFESAARINHMVLDELAAFRAAHT